APSVSMAMCRGPFVPVLYYQCESDPVRPAILCRNSQNRVDDICLQLSRVVFRLRAFVLSCFRERPSSSTREFRLRSACTVDGRADAVDRPVTIGPWFPEKRE